MNRKLMSLLALIIFALGSTPIAQAGAGEVAGGVAAGLGTVVLVNALSDSDDNYDDDSYEAERARREREQEQEDADYEDDSAEYKEE